MGSWGIAETASEKEKIKSEFADFINGMNSCGEIDYNIYSQLFDFAMPLFDKMFEHGKMVTQQRYVKCSHVIGLICGTIGIEAGKCDELKLHEIYHKIVEIKNVVKELSQHFA